jgi:hypothetical protein
MEYELRLLDSQGSILERVKCTSLVQLGSEIVAMGRRLRSLSRTSALDVFGGEVSLDLWWIRGTKEQRLNEGQRAKALAAAQDGGVVLIHPPRRRFAAAPVGTQAA